MGEVEAVLNRVGIVYGTKSKLVRRVVVPDETTDWAHHVNEPHESLYVMQLYEDTTWLPDIHAAFYQELGITEPSARCAVVNADGVVVNVLMADPLIDTSPDGRLIQHDTANVGDQFIDGVLQVVGPEPITLPTSGTQTL